MVNSQNEWDALEEVLVGDVVGAVYPPFTPITAANGDPRWLASYAGLAVEDELVVAASEQLSRFVGVLEQEGVRVHRPDPFPHGEAICGPEWRSRSGWNAANPRDLFLVVGETIIEAASPHRHRLFERHAYRATLEACAAHGARWFAAPLPRLHDASFDHGRMLDAVASHDDAPLPSGEAFASPIGEREALWEAADFVRCGSFLVGMRSHVTNARGLAWVERHAGLPVVELHTRCPRPNHIDTTFVPLRDGVALVHPTWVDRGALPEALAEWTLLPAPPPRYREDSPMASPYFTSQWLSMNVFSLDRERVFVDEQQRELIALLESEGFEPIPLPFDAVGAFGGSFHCVTLDLRRSAVAGDVPSISGD